MFLIHSFLLGLAGSFHCIGMCGPIAMALPLDRTSTIAQVLGLSAYNLGRIFTYSLLGLLFGFIGFSLSIYRIFQILSIIFGIILILLAWKKTWIKYFEWRTSPVYGFVMRKMSVLLQSKNVSSFFLMGMLNGLLPCGMIFIGLASSLLTPNFWGSGMAMFAFGLGTVPGMFAVGFLAQKMGSTFRLRMNQIYPYLMTLIGVMVILRGSNLGIPYLSPKIEQTEAKNHVTGNEPKTIQVICHSPDSSRKKEE